MHSPFLQPGDTIAIAATARKISELELQPGIQLFNSWGLKTVFSPTLFCEENQFGGSDTERARGLQTLLDDPNIQAIIVARGGYGTVRIIDQLDFTKFCTHPKWIIGYSDITVLHSHIHRHFGIETIHGPMMLNFTSERIDEESNQTLWKVLSGASDRTITIKTHSMNKPGSASGKLIGGNLSVLFSLMGSASDIDTNNRILFLEDLDEYVYHIDRMMMNLKRNGKLDKLAGLIIGDMSDMKDNAIPFGMSAYEIIAYHTKEFNYPVCFGFPAGHEKRNLALRFGAETKLDIRNDMVSFSQ